MATVRTYGTRRDVRDPRDLRYATPHHLRRRLPPRVDLRPLCPPVFHQGKLNSCSANAIASAMWFDEIREGYALEGAPSRLFIYYNERLREGLIGSNAPVSLRDGYKSVARAGACREKHWPYRVSAFRRRPPSFCYRSARERRVTSYMRVRRGLGPMRACLAEGFPFTFAATVYRSFESARVARTGRVPMPRRGERILGGHAMLVVGYDDAEERFIVRNSFGRRWGDRGYCYMPYDYFLHPDLAWDFWTARFVSMPRRHR